MFSSAAIISIIAGWYTTRSCAQINFIFGRTNTLAVYPACVAYYNGANVNQHVVVKATESTGANPMEVGASLGVTFGAAGWMAFWLHATGVELYVSLTSDRSIRPFRRQWANHHSCASRLPNPNVFVKSPTSASSLAASNDLATPA